MRRRRSVPWIYRWSRPIIGGISILGALLTAYLTVEKLTGSEVVCNAAASGAAGCNDVLSSAYATVFGLPLTLFGFLAYTSMASLALVPLAVNAEENKKLRKKLEEWSWLLLLIGGVAMAVFSSYLMYVLASEIKAFCPYCIGSAIFSWSLLTLTIIGRDWEDLGQIIFTGFIVAIVTLVGTLGVYSQINVSPASDNPAEVAIDPQSGRIIIPEPEGQPEAPYGWKVNTASGEAEVELAEHLTAIGAKKYGAYFCPHCYEQKQLFGKAAFDKIDYIECNPAGKDPKPQLCQEKGIRSVPTWEINGQYYSGVQSLDRLAEVSGYKGATDFKYIKLGL